MSAEEWVSGPWVNDENHQTINGERFVARECCACSSKASPGPDCELLGTSGCNGRKCGGTNRKDSRSVRWYRADSPALAFFDGRKEEPKPATDPVRPLSEICMLGIRSSLKTLFQDRDRQDVEALRYSRAANLDARVQAAMDAILTVPDSFATPAPAPAPAPAPEDDVEIIIDPTPEQVPEGGAWGCWWDVEPTMLGQIGLVPKMPDKAAQVIKNCAWAHFAIIVRGYLGPCDLVYRVRKMLAEKEGKK